MRLNFSFLLGVSFLGYGILGALFVPEAIAALDPQSVHVAESKKTEAYVRDGLFTGGDRAIDDVTVKDIRRAANPGFERIVIDLEGNQNGEPAAIPRPPYFHVAVTPDEKRLVFTLWGKPKVAFDSKKVLAAFKKSPIIESVEFLPKVEDDSWTFVMSLKADRPVEVFELRDPVRIIVDVRTQKTSSKPAANHPAPAAHSGH